MARVPDYWYKGMDYLHARDAVVSSLMHQYKVPQLTLRKDAFTTLARAIAGQQISVKAADAVWKRVVQAAGGRESRIAPASLLALSAGGLRGCGLSERKVAYILNLAEQFAQRKLTGRALRRLDDRGVHNALTQLKGIGPWTADMYLIFNLWRPNVLPVGDIGLIRAIEQNYCRGRKISEKKLESLRTLWSPFATVAVWYLWRSLDPYPVEY